LQGDREALNQIGTRHPDTLMKIAPLLDRADAATRTRAKEASEWTTKAAMGVLSLPPEQRPAAYQAALAEGQRLGYQIDMPPQYDRAVEGRLNQVINQARPIADYFKGRDEGFDLVPSGGGGGAAPPSAGAPPNREAFLQTITPHALEVSKATGLDPRLVIAQSALETGYGQSAPGNNYFGVKSHGNPGGQVLATTEAGPNGMYGTRDSFRTYGTPGESARDYVEFLRTNSRYAPVLQAQGIDAQIEALGRSGYASDPQYAAKLRQIVQSLPPVGPQPAGREVAYGGNAAPMPQPPSGMAVPGTPAPMPQPPGIAQGDTAPPADASGTPIPTSDGGSVPREVMRMITPNLPPGTSLGRDRKTGLFKVQEGNFVVYDSNRNPVGLIPIPKPKEQGTGPFTGTGTEAQALNMLIANGTLTPQQAAELAAGKTVTDPETKQIIFMTPSGIFGGRPGQPPQPIAGPSPGMAAPAPMPSAGSPAGVPAPAAPAVTVPANPGALPLTGTQSKGQPSATEMAKLRSARVEADKITAAANDFKTEWAKATPAERARSLAGANTPLNASYNNFALLAKGDALFQLGVLNGPDLDIIRRTIPDPSTWKSIMTSENDVTSSVDKVLNILNNGVSSTERQLGITPPQGAQGKQTAKPGTYLGPDNSPISWPEIEATAKNRGITTDEVVNRLGLKPTGMQ
jgi:hypothetical protein